MSDDAARVEVERVWNAHVPTEPGRDLSAILAAAGPSSALLVGGVQLTDLPDPVAAEVALKNAGFVVSLELRRSAVTAHADVVFPVAAAAEKAGRYVTWEGRRRPFDQPLTNTGQLSDGRVLDALADELDVVLGLNSIEAARAELDQLPAATSRVSAPSVAPRPEQRPDGPHQLVLASWSELIDAGSMLDGEPNLAGTAKPLRAVIGKQTALQLGLAEGDQVRIEAAGRLLRAPVQLKDEAIAGVVWLPANHRDGSVRVALNVEPGALVMVTRDGDSAATTGGAA